MFLQNRGPARCPGWLLRLCCSTPSQHGQLLLSCLLLYGVEIWPVPRATHVGSTDWNRYMPLIANFPPWTPQSAASTA